MTPLPKEVARDWKTKLACEKQENDKALQVMSGQAGAVLAYPKMSFWAPSINAYQYLYRRKRPSKQQLGNG